MLNIVLKDTEKSFYTQSIFKDATTMATVRFICALVLSIIIVKLVIIPFWLYLRKWYKIKYPNRKNNPFMKAYNRQKQNDKDYNEYLRWVARNGYEPVIKKRESGN